MYYLSAMKMEWRGRLFLSLMLVCLPNCIDGLLSKNHLIQLLQLQGMSNPWIFGHFPFAFRIQVMKAMLKINSVASFGNESALFEVVERDHSNAKNLVIYSVDFPIDYREFYAHIQATHKVLTIYDGSVINKDFSQGSIQLQQNVQFLEISNVSRENWPLSEAYTINNIFVRNSLGHYERQGNSQRLRFVPTKDLGDFGERRGNFEGKTLIAMTEMSDPFTGLKSGYKSIFHPENQTYEVNHFVKIYPEIAMQYNEVISGDQLRSWLLLGCDANITAAAQFHGENIFKKGQSLGQRDPVTEWFSGYRWRCWRRCKRLVRSCINGFEFNKGFFSGNADIFAANAAMILERFFFVDYLPVLSAPEVAIFIHSNPVENVSWRLFIDTFEPNVWMLLATQGLALALFLTLVQPQSVDIKVRY